MIENYFRNNRKDGFNIQFVHTGQYTQTGSRLLKLKEYLKDEENLCLHMVMVYVTLI